MSWRPGRAGELLGEVSARRAARRSKRSSSGRSPGRARRASDSNTASSWSDSGASSRRELVVHPRGRLSSATTLTTSFVRSRLAAPRCVGNAAHRREERRGLGERQLDHRAVVGEPAGRRRPPPSAGGRARARTPRARRSRGTARRRARRGCRRGAPPVRNELGAQAGRTFGRGRRVRGRRMRRRRSVRRRRTQAASGGAENAAGGWRRRFGQCRRIGAAHTGGEEKEEAAAGRAANGAAAARPQVSEERLARSTRMSRLLELVDDAAHRDDEFLLQAE